MLKPSPCPVLQIWNSIRIHHATKEDYQQTHSISIRDPRESGSSDSEPQGLFHQPNNPENNPTEHDDDPDENHLATETTTTLAEAIMLMTQELRRRETPEHKAKVKEPDTFDGSNPKKLNNFILLCNLFFHNSPAYSNDKHKVTFALSYLRGTSRSAVL
jgi:hypothetical protein